MSASWKTCKCGNKMKVTNTWDDKSRLECPQCKTVRHVKHVRMCDVIKLQLTPQK